MRESPPRGTNPPALDDFSDHRSFPRGRWARPVVVPCGSFRLGVAALWAAGVDPTARPAAVASDVCPEPATHNIAESFGLRECLRNALRDPPPSAIFELDSLLVIMMTSGLWGCHRKHLLTLLKECYDPGEQLAAAGCSWFVRLIYREYNTVADELAGQCIRTGRGTSRNLR